MTRAHRKYLQHPEVRTLVSTAPDGPAFTVISDLRKDDVGLGSGLSIDRKPAVRTRRR